MNPRKLLRIARWEVTKSAGTVDRITVALVILGAALGVVVGPQIVSGGVDLGEGIYRVGVDESSPYHDVVERNERFVAVDTSFEKFREGDSRADVYVRDGRIYYHEDRRKSRAAYSAFRGAIERYNDAIMAAEANESAAFPVNVSLSYRSRAIGRVGAVDGARDQGGGDGTGDAAGDGPAADDGETTGDGGTDGDGGGTGAETGDGDVAVPNVGGGGGGVFGGRSTGSPSEIRPPFPFQSLILAFVFVVPMNFVVQAYGSSIMDERINRRGELMLVSPVTRGDIVGGKTLPYFLGMVAITAAIALAVGGGAIAVAAVVPVALLFLAGTFVAGMFARSFKELSFVTVSMSVFLTSYVFVPAIFTEITPIALISPLTIVVRDLRGVPVAVGEYAFSTGPFYLAAGVLFLLGMGVYREEDMFTQRPVHLKAVDALASRISGALSVAVLTAALLPFVFLLELLAIATLFVLPGDVSVILLLVGIAVIEEVAKALGPFAGFAKARFDRSLRTAVVVGALSGVGFFVGEKLTLLAQLVGLPELRIGGAAFRTGLADDPLVVAALFFAPLALHVVTATISAVGASRDRRTWIAAVCIAIVVHVAYNFGVINVVG